MAYFPNEFWKEFLNKFNEQALENIGIYNKIRSAFVNYFSLLTDLKRIILSEILDKYYNEAEKFYDEFASLFDEFIKKVISKKKKIFIKF